MVYRKDYQAPCFIVDAIDLDIKLADEGTLVTSHLKIRRDQSMPQKRFQLDGVDLELVSVKLNGALLSSHQYQLDESHLMLDSVPDTFEIETVSKIYPERNLALSGLYRSRQAYCTQCEAEGFRRITYFMDRPDVLTRFTTKITADKKRYPILLSNGNLIDQGELEDGRHWVKWEDPFKKPCYLFALVAGDFDLREDSYTTVSKKEISLRIYVEKGYKDQTQHAMQSLKAAMRWDEETYGREYDLDSYMIVAISDFNMGAMENKGLNIFNTKYILARPDTATDEDAIHIYSVIGHEYFHNWSGNRVTCRDWFQLSLKEGLTIFRDQSFSEDTLSHAFIRIGNVRYLRDTQFPEDAGPLAHPVRPDAYIEINNFYTVTIYEKGAEVLRMLKTILGRDSFRRGMDLYFSRFDGQAVTIDDFISTMEEVSHVNLTQFRLWYSQAGTPDVTVKSDYDETKHCYTLYIEQKTAPTPNQKTKKPLMIPIKISLLDHNANVIPLSHDQSDHEKVLLLTKENQSFTFEHIVSKPIPSLLRDFSSPVKLHYSYTDEELIFLFKYDTDPFNRWDAGHRYFTKILLKMVQSIQERKTLQLPQTICDMFSAILKHEVDDPLLVSEMLTLPSSRYIAEQMTVIDVDAIYASREFALQCIAKSLETIFFDIYHRFRDNKTQFDMTLVGKRRLKNLCLSYLMQLPQHVSLGVQQFKTHLKSNMTETESALVALSHLDLPDRENALSQFYSAWQGDALIVDKWLAIQAQSKRVDALNHIKLLMKHPAFDIKNPNKVYALIGTFANRNMVRFHAKDGEGYVFLRECVSEIDHFNPQIAARMLIPLTPFKRYDKERQVLMKKQLEILLNQKISKDVFELVSKSLA